MKLGDLEINLPTPERKDWIDWTVDREPPECGAILDGGELGKIHVCDVQTRYDISDYCRTRIRIEIAL